MECRARVLYRRGRGCVTGTPAGCVAGVPGAVGPARSPLGFTVPSGPGEPVLVPEGGGPPARSPHASLRLGVVDLEARPGPAAALRHPECTLARRHPPHWWRGCVVSGQALPPLSDTEVVAASLVFWVPSGPPARSPSAPRACGSARRLEARPGPAVPPAPSTLPCGPDGTLHTGGVGVSWAARPERGGSTASAQNYRAHDGVCENVTD